MLVNQSLTTFTVARADFLVAARTCDRHELGLRAGDALHLAVALRLGARMQTLDQRMLAMAQHVGVAAGRPVA
ncbi:MAG: hypothetical protein ACR2KG_11330 [Nocardioidaceae bacterium]